MPSSTSSSRPLRSLAWVLALGLLVEALCGLAMRSGLDTAAWRYYPPDRPPGVMESVVQWKASHLVEGRYGRADVILLGDSSCLTSLVPSVFEQDGLTALNLGTVSHLSVQGHADFLELYMDLHGPPRAVVYQVSNTTLYFDEKDIREAGILKLFEGWLQAVHHPAFLADRLPWTDRLPSSNAAWSIKRRLRGSMPAHFLSEPRGHFPSDIAVRNTMLETHGFLEETAQSDYAGGTPVLTLSPFAAKGLQRLFALCAQRRVPLLVYLVPLPDSLDTPETAQRGDSLRQAIQATADGYPGVTIPEPFIRFTPTALSNGIGHLLLPGAEANSSSVAKGLEDVLHRGRDTAGTGG